jgi:hypothetical protein
MTWLSRARGRSLHGSVFIVVTAAVLLLSGCAGVEPSLPPGRSAEAASSPSAAAAASAVALPSATPTETSRRSPSPASSAKATTRPSASASAAAGRCAVDPQRVALPSDRFTSVKITSLPDTDVITFGFGNDSLPGPPAPPIGSVAAAKPPYTNASSGAAMGLSGQHAAQITFKNMSIQNDVGEPVYDGPTEYRPRLPALRHLVMFDMSEGVVGWYIGYDGSGCVTLARVANAVTVRIAHR